MSAIKAFTTALRGYTDPSSANSSDDARLAEYRFFWDVFQNAIFDRALGTVYDKVKTDQRLVPYIRSLYNPAARGVNFYRGVMYPGTVTVDGENVEGALRAAVPLPKDLDDDLKGAIGQVLRWSNWQTTAGDYVMFGAALGEVALEIEDAAARSKVLVIPRYPGEIVDFERDGEGNVTFYAREYESQVTERVPGGTAQVVETYTYRKEVDRDWIRTFKNGELFSYDDVPKEQPNFYGFVPLVWVRHDSRGGDRGAPFIAGSLPAMEAINHLLSILIKDTEKVSLSPYVLATSSQLGPALSPEAKAVLDQAEVKLALLKGNEDTSGFPIESGLDTAQVLEACDRIVSFIERDHPELTMYESLREMSTVTGPAARRLVGDTAALVSRAAANYDDGLVRACQMAISMAAIRQQQGAWERKGSAQDAFLPFTPESFFKGDLDFEILPRPLLPDTPAEHWDAETKRATAAGLYVPLFGGSEVLALEQVGFSEDELREKITRLSDVIEKAQLAAQADIPVGRLGAGNGNGVAVPEQ